MKYPCRMLAGGLFVTVALGCAAQAAEPKNKPVVFDMAREQTSLGNEWAKWFAADMRLRPVEHAPFPVFAVCSATGKTNGWVFRTDRVPPVVIGKRGEIGVLTAIGTDGLIKGVHVLENHETPYYFNRLNDAFYRKFPGKSAGTNSLAKVDAVTGSTFSSKAVIGDVFQSSQSVLDLPAVKAVVKRTE